MGKGCDVLEKSYKTIFLKRVGKLECQGRDTSVLTVIPKNVSLGCTDNICRVCECGQKQRLGCGKGLCLAFSVQHLKISPEHASTGHKQRHASEYTSLQFIFRHSKQVLTQPFFFPLFLNKLIVSV